MPKLVLTIFSAFCLAMICRAQVTFSDASSSLAYPGTRSAAPIGAADMNGDDLDDIVRLHSATTFRIDYQKLTSGFTGYTFGNLTGSGREWGMCVADVDENGFNDCIAGGEINGLKLLLADSTGSAYTQSVLPTPPTGPIHLQGSNFVDINNDGELDYFGANDIGLSAPYRGDNTGTFVYDTSLIYPVSTNFSFDNSGNYGSVWTDYDWDGDIDLYISKCKPGVEDSLDGRRLNLMFENDGTNEYTDVAETIGLRPFAQSWSTDFGDLDNDGDQDALILLHSHPSRLYYNDGTNHYMEMTDSAGVSDEMGAMTAPIQVIMEDFDNDGLLDILVTNVDSTGHRLFWNMVGMEFEHTDTVFPDNLPDIHSAAVGDFNHDGFMDIIAGHGTYPNNPSAFHDDDLLINQGNSNHFLSIRTVGVSTHINGIGSRLKLVSDLGQQFRDIRGGESYGIMNSLNAHFGLGTDTIVDTLIIWWASGVRDTLLNLSPDQFLTLHEGVGPCDCNSPQVRMVTEATGDGEGSLPFVTDHACPGDTIRFAPALHGDTLFLDRRLMIGKDLYFDGPGMQDLHIATTTTTTAFRIQPGIHCTISGLTITDVSSSPPLYLVENAGELRLIAVAIHTTAGHPFHQQTGTIYFGDGSVMFE